MPVRRAGPKRNHARNTARNTSRRKSSSRITSTVVETTRKEAEGTGSRWAETFTREPDVGHGLPKAARPTIATTPAEIRARAHQKREANRRRGAANNVRGYVRPGWTTAKPLPSAEELLASTAEQPTEQRMPTAEELLHLTQEQEFASTAPGEGTYLFPQVSPTKTINPIRPRTLESGYERIKDENDPRYPGVLRVRFRDGTAWEYWTVPSSVWQRFKRVQSPGRFIIRVLDGYPYGPGNF